MGKNSTYKQLPHYIIFIIHDSTDTEYVMETTHLTGTLKLKKYREGKANKRSEEQTNFG